MTEHDKAVALELTRVYFQTVVAKNVPIETIGKVQSVYLDILQDITCIDRPCSPEVLAIPASNAPEVTASVV